MHIAIIAPSPVPFCIGGTENLFWGLVRTINQFTPHQAELIKLPSREANLWELVATYRQFSQLDLSHFDLVISTKYPAWMVSHPRHICYLQHRLRGLYDTYYLTNLPETYETTHPALEAFKRFLQSHHGVRSALDEAFDRLDTLWNRKDIPPNVFQFPSPFAREVVHFFDGVGLADDAILKFCTIAQTVANRVEYFPAGRDVEVIHHPSNLQGFWCGKDDYLFTVSRLDGPKRIALLIEAMRYVKSDVTLKIAGTGPDAEQLQQMARQDKRITFLGFVKDAEIVALYANALAVPYIPYEEDYGLITIEAMMSGKPVLTVHDAGGPNEFVRNGETGFSAPPTPQALAERLDYFCQHREEAKQMGRTARQSVQHITWERTVARLLGEEEQPLVRASKAYRRKRVTVAAPFPIYPPRGGGQNRIYYLYQQLARRFDVDIVTLTNENEAAFHEEIAPGLREIRLPKSAAHAEAEAKLSSQVDWIPITDIVLPQLYHLTPAYGEALQTSTARADIVIASHPYVLPAIREVSDKLLWYEAQDVEIDLKRAILPDTATGHDLLKQVEHVEKTCCQQSALIMVCATEDGNRLQDLYDVEQDKIVEVPNGVDLNTVRYVPLAERLEKKRALGLDSTFNVLFLGSWHGPNIEAVRHIFRFAQELPQVNFLIVGSVGLAFREEIIPTNVGLMGVIDDDTKDAIFGIVDLAVNPMLSGTGTNLKMLDYCAAGIPVISTSHGLRGLTLENKTHLEAVLLDAFPTAIQTLRQNWKDLHERVEQARACVAKYYDWAVIAENFAAEVVRRGRMPL